MGWDFRSIISNLWWNEALKTFKSATGRASILFFFLLLLGVSFVFLRLQNEYSIQGTSNGLIWNPFRWPSVTEKSLSCPNATDPVTCPDFSLGSKPFKEEMSMGPECPEYFRWIHEDLRVWNQSGITREMVESGKKFADFRLVIIDGKAYVETYHRSFQTRDIFTIWGILQLLRLHPGRIPDLDLLFACGDVPMVPMGDYGDKGLVPPPVFHYCGDDTTHDIVFPDWSFWGWPEVHIKPWEALLKELKAGNERSKWKDRNPTAYWKGNPYVSGSRQDLMKCKSSSSQDWNARLYVQNWEEESRHGFRESNLANQCTHRYKIYIEGVAWSVSRKYILACDSPTLLVSPRYYDFFSRSLMPNYHFWPIRVDDKCRSIKFAVDWGNIHKKEAQHIGRTGSNFIEEGLKMEYVYDYMFHTLNEYAKLLRYKPEVPAAAKRVCSESTACRESGLVQKYMKDSIVVKGKQSTIACTLRPYDPSTLISLSTKKKEALRQVQKLEQQAWDNQTKT